jgi:hypothetical protein
VTAIKAPIRAKSGENLIISRLSDVPKMGWSVMSG